MEDYKQLAQDIVRCKRTNLKSVNFHDSSFIYKKSNEQLENFQEYLENRKKVLSVIGSGDQILNTLLTSPDKIDAFDISVYPGYFLKLKMAAIEALSREEYLTFFFDTITPSNDELYDDLYFYKISKYLDQDSKDFWDYLFEFNDWYDIYNSTLFSSEPCVLSRAIEQNKYLQKDEYNKLKNIIPTSKINIIVDNILDMNIKEEYDLVYLSNIIQYVDIMDYIRRIKSLTEGKQTEVLTYIFGEVDEVVTYFNNTEGISFNGNGLLIHR